jgi:pyridoxal phosphate phosphatase PHOSPHO2
MVCFFPTGAELAEFLSRHEQFDRVIYVGDGSNDFCPALTLRAWVLSIVVSLHLSDLMPGITHSQDILLCRSYRGLERRIISAPEEHQLKCQLKKWGGAWEVEEIFNELISQP